MARNQSTITDAKKLVKDVLSKHFKQEIDAATLREVAQRVADTLPTNRSETRERERCAA